MRKRWLFAAVPIAAAAYWAWPYLGAYTLAQAAELGAPEAVAARVDFPAIRHGLAKQVIRAYLDRTGRGAKLGAFGRGMAVAVGTSVADPYLAQLISPDSLTALLRDGRVHALDVDGRTIRFDQTLPKLPDVLGSKILPVVLASYYDGPTSFVFNVDAPDGTGYGLHLGLEGTTWRLSGIDLPPTLVNRIVDDIVAREEDGKSL